MASFVATIFAGFAFAGASKLVNLITPNHASEEIKRHNLAMEEYTKARNDFDDKLSARRQKMLERKNEISVTDLNVNKNQKYLDEYAKWEQNYMQNEPNLKDFLEKYNYHSIQGSEYDNLKKFGAVLGVLSGVGLTYYVFKSEGAHTKKIK